MHNGRHHASTGMGASSVVKRGGSSRVSVRLPSAMATTVVGDRRKLSGLRTARTLAVAVTAGGGRGGDITGSATPSQSSTVAVAVAAAAELRDRRAAFSVAGVKFKAREAPERRLRRRPAAAKQHGQQQQQNRV